MAVLLEIASVLVHGNMDDAAQDGEHLVICFETFLEFKVFVPEGMSQKVKANAACPALEQPVRGGVSMKRAP